MTTLDAALDYAENYGWSVFPLNGKQPATRHGFKDATTDTATITGWFQVRHGVEPYNIGVAIPEGMWVLDVDPRNGGMESFEKIQHLLPKTLTTRTGSGGGHLWFSGDPSSLPKMKGIDIKVGGKGYVVVPPSVHPETGKEYVWSRKEFVADYSGQNLTPSPEDGFSWDLSGDPRELAESKEPISLGEQHETLVKIAAHLLAKYPEPIAEAAFYKRAEDCDPPHPDDEVERIWAWALKKQANGEGLVQEDEPEESGTVTPPGGKRELDTLRAREWAKEQLDQERSGQLAVPVFKTAEELADEPDEDVEWRIQDLMPRHGSAVLYAGAKVGKTVIVGHLVHSMLTGEPFLDEWEAERVKGNIVLVDMELSPNNMRKWTRKFHNDFPNFRIATMRGRASSMKVMSDAQFERIADAIREQEPEVLIIDPLSPILSAHGIEENNNEQVRQLLDRFMALAKSVSPDPESQCELIISHHAGHGSKSRTRGASSILDWPDSLIGVKLKKEDDYDSPRILNAFGRDVMVPKTELIYDRETYRLVVNKTPSERRVIEDVIRQGEGLTVAEIHQAAKTAGRDIADTTLRRFLKELEEDGTVVSTDRKQPRGRPVKVYAWVPSAL